MRRWSDPRKKSQLQQNLTRQFFETIVTTQHLETIVSNHTHTHHEAHSPQRLSAHRRPLGHRPCLDIARVNAFPHLYRRYPRAVLDNRSRLCEQSRSPQVGSNFLLTSRQQDMELLLVKHYYLPAGSGLDPIQTIFQNRTVAKGSDTYNWTVPNVKDGGLVNFSPLNKAVMCIPGH